MSPMTRTPPTRFAKPTPEYPMARPAALSDAARVWLENGGDTFDPDPSLDVPGLRAAREACYGADASAILDGAGLTSSETSLGGVRCRVVTPDNAVPEQAVYYAFGGGFMFGSPEQDMAIIAGLAQETRRTVIAPYYRLAPENHYPSGQDDCSAALRAALDSHKSLALAGESAGATMIMVAAARALVTAGSKICAIAIMSPCSDLAEIGDSALTNRDPVLDLDRVQAVAGVYAPGFDLKNPELSIVYREYGPDFPPTLVTTGTRDLFLSGCVRLDRVMREGGAPVTLRVWEGMWHAFEFYGDALPEAKASLTDIGQFLRTHLDSA